MLEILNSSILGNLIGIVSLIVSGLTLIKTKLVSSQIEKLKIETKRKVRFEDYRPEAIKTLESKRNAIRNAEYMSDNMLYELLQLTRTINDFAFLNPKSKKIISNAHDYMKTIISTHSSSDKEKQIQLFDYLTQIINILKKGD